MVLAEVHRRLEMPVRRAEELRPHEQIPRQVEAELRGDPGKRQDENDDRDDDSHGVARKPRLERAAGAPPGSDGQPEREGDTHAGDEVLPARVEVRLADEQGHRRAERDRRPGEPPGAARQIPHRHEHEHDRDERERPVRVHRRAAEPEAETVALHVVELGGVDPRVGDDDREQRQEPDGPDGQGLALSTPSHRAYPTRPDPSKLAPAVARLFLSPPHLSGAELDLLRDAVESNWIAPLGPHVDAFEAELAAATGARSVLALSSGTAALHLALVVNGIGAGDEVACSSLTFAASANPIVYSGAAPFFVDCDESWLIDPSLLDEAIAARKRDGGRVRAVIAVDLYGRCCDYEAIADVCARHDVVLIQDAAESLGATYRGAPSGTQAPLAALSFNGNKIITTSGGGALAGSDEALVAHARKLSTQAREPVPHYEHTEIGFNYRLSNLLAAVGRAQLAVLPERVAARQRINARYRELLGDAPGIDFMPAATDGTSNCWLTCITVDPALVRSRPGADQARARGGGHRGAPRVEADAPAARVRGQPDLRRRRLRPPVRARALPAERLGDDRRRSGPRRQHAAGDASQAVTRYGVAATSPETVVSTTSSQCAQRSLRPLTVSR